MFNEKPVSGVGNKGLLVRVIVVGGLVLGGLGWVGMGWYNSRETEMGDREIQSARVEYTKMDKPLVSGELRGKIDGTNWSGKTLSLCPVEDGKVIKKGNDYFLECLKKDLKQTSVTDDNVFEIRLKPGNYFINSQMEKDESSQDLPARVSVKGGEVGEMVIKILSR